MLNLGLLKADVEFCGDDTWNYVCGPLVLLLNSVEIDFGFARAERDD